MRTPPTRTPRMAGRTVSGITCVPMSNDAPADTPSPAAPSSAWAWTLSVITALLLAVALRIEGRVWWCNGGEAYLYSNDINSMHNSQHLLDPYTISHVLHGLLFFFAIRWLWPKLAVPWQLWVAISIEVAWEVAENSPIVINRYRAATMALGYEGDSVANSVGDLLAAVVGFLIAWRVGWKVSLALFVASELIMLWWIKDNLTLNVIMLLFPIDAIRRWQGA